LIAISLVFLTLVTSGYQVDAAKKYRIVLVAKQEGIPWFDDMRKGVNEFNTKYSDSVEAKQIAPEAGDSAKQNQMIEDLIAQGVDAICVVPNDPNAMKPVLTKAKQKGIVIISHEASALASTNVVDFDLEAFNNKDFGVLMFDTLAKAMGGKGKYAAMVGGLTMQTHMEWYNAGLKYVKTKYPNMKIVTAQPFEDKNDDALARDNAMQILKAYPDLKGFVGTSVSAGSNFAAVLKEKNKKNISVVSLGIPSVDGPYLKDGFMVQAQCWRPADAGFAACLAALKILKSEKIQNGSNLDRTGYNKVKVQGKIIYGNAPLVLTKDTVDKYSF
jgi:simple sugar transport system substrate-binding protein